MRARDLLRLTGSTALAAAVCCPSALASVSPTAVGNPVLVTPDDSGDKAFGSSVDVDGNTMVVAAVCDTTVGGNCDGSVYAFVRSGDDWVQQQKLLPPDPQQYAEFGASVAVSGDTIVVGSDLYHVRGASTGGKAYVYVRSGSTWSLQAQLLHRNPQPVDNFGNSVAIDGDTIVVAAWRDDVGAHKNAGSATVFSRTGARWTEQALLRASDGSEDLKLGTSVAVQGDLILAGATGADTELGEDAGAVYTFERSGQTWQQGAILTDTGATDDANLGAAVALDGDTAVAVTDSFVQIGRIPVFVRTGQTWEVQAVLVPPAGYGFHQALDISGDVVVVGNRYDSHVVRSNGAAYVYLRSGEDWASGIRLRLKKPEVQDQFGVGVAADGDLVAIGAFTDPEAVHVYER